MKRASKKQEPTTSERAPMDASVNERRVGVPHTNTRRVCWAIKTLNEEIWALFPGTPVEYSNYDERNTALDVTYDLSVLDAGDVYGFTSLMHLLQDSAYNDDPRLNVVIIDKDAPSVLVSMNPSARTKDLRTPFGLAEAWAVWSDEEDSLDGGGASGDGATVEGGGATDISDDVIAGGGA